MCLFYTVLSVFLVENRFRKRYRLFVCVVMTDLEARERQAEAQSQEEVQITRTLEEEVRETI